MRRWRSSKEDEEREVEDKDVEEIVVGKMEER